MENHLYLLMTYFSPSSSSEVAETPFKTLIFLISAHRILSISAEILTFTFFFTMCIIHNLKVFFRLSSIRSLAFLPFKMANFFISAHKDLSITIVTLSLCFSFFTSIMIYFCMERFKKLLPNISVCLHRKPYRRTDDKEGMKWRH